MYRTHNCGELNEIHCNKIVKLSGWVDSIRLMKNFTFVDIRDFYGITQLFIKDTKITFKKEYLIQVLGKVVKRKSPNLKINTGRIEILVIKYSIISKSIKLPINIKKNIKKNKKNLLKYRYLYLRNAKLKKNLINKSNLLNIIRTYFIKNNFLEIDTPLLVKSTSEGARNFIIPYRKKSGLFYSLPQSPQTFKQLLMIGGIDKYYQIAKCFRDEDARMNRQPEFLQLDIEMSLIKRKTIFKLINNFIKFIFYKIHKIKINNVKLITYKKAKKTYNTDKPDLRYRVYQIYFKIKKTKILKKYFNHYIIGLVLPNYFNIKKLDNNKIRDLLNKYSNAKYYFLYSYKNKLNSKNIFKNKKVLVKILDKYLFNKDDLLLIIVKENKNLNSILIKKINKFLLNSKYLKKCYIPILIYKFPLFKYNKKKNTYSSFHHPFTKPYKSKNLYTEGIKIENIIADSYDLVINGIEIGSGSIRINNKILQKRVFKILKIPKKKIINNFGFFLKSLEYGAPPHGGIGIGIDRLMLALYNKKRIIDFIAFPKNYLNKDLMINTPSKIKK